VTEQPARVCGHWNGSEHRHTDGVRPYPIGHRCPQHTPRALQGLPETPPGPGLPDGAWTTPSPLNDSRVHDAQAIASGKRRSTPTTYRAAQAATARKAPA